MEYIIYNVKDDGFEDLLWYTESPDEVAKSEAIKRFDDIVRDYPEIYYRLWGIDRSKPIPNKRELLKEHLGYWTCKHGVTHDKQVYCPICLKESVSGN